MESFHTNCNVYFSTLLSKKLEPIPVNYLTGQIGEFVNICLWQANIKGFVDLQFRVVEERVKTQNLLGFFICLFN